MVQATDNQIICMDSVDFFEKLRKPLNWWKLAKNWQWKADEKPSQIATIFHTPPKKSHVRNKCSLSSLIPQLAIQPCSDTSRTFYWKSLSLVGLRFKNRREAKINTFRGTAFSHKNPFFAWLYYIKPRFIYAKCHLLLFLKVNPWCSINLIFNLIFSRVFTKLTLLFLKVNPWCSINPRFNLISFTKITNRNKWKEKKKKDEDKDFTCQH